jgi:hypothetical protein
VKVINASVQNNGIPKAVLDPYIAEYQSGQCMRDDEENVINRHAVREIPDVGKPESHCVRPEHRRIKQSKVFVYKLPWTGIPSPVKPTQEPREIDGDSRYGNQRVVEGEIV